MPINLIDALLNFEKIKIKRFFSRSHDEIPVFLSVLPRTENQDSYGLFTENDNAILHLQRCKFLAVSDDPVYR